MVAVQKGSFEGLAKRRGNLRLFIVEGPRRKIASKPGDYSWGSYTWDPSIGEGSCKLATPGPMKGKVQRRQHRT